jgi:RsiW-degrading membrane proteinase PrsW (M82 family)
MHLTNREIWALVHGMLIGGPFLLGFTGVLAGLVGLRAEHMTAEGIRGRVTQLRVGSSLLAVMAWSIALIGTWVLLPWYQEDAPDSPRSILLADPSTAQWHEFADVWKTHVAYMAPILTTTAAFLVVYYGRALARERSLRNLVLALFLGAFAVSSLAALIGSLVTRAAPIR